MLKTRKRPKGSIDRAFAARIRTENRDQASICSFALREVSVLAELALGHLRYRLADVPPQSNSPPDTVLGVDRVRVPEDTLGRSLTAPSYSGRPVGLPWVAPPDPGAPPFLRFVARERTHSLSVHATPFHTAWV